MPVDDHCRDVKSSGAGGCDDKVTGSDSRTGRVNMALLSESEASLQPLFFTTLNS